MNRHPVKSAHDCSTILSTILVPINSHFRLRMIVPHVPYFLFFFLLFIYLFIYLFITRYYYYYFYHHFCFPAQLVGGFTLSDLLDKPWSQVSSLFPTGTCLQFLSRIGFSIPTARRFSSNVANSRSRAFR